MTIRERCESFWAGERPEKIPYTIYQNEWRHTRDDPAWDDMFQAGLGVTMHVGPYRSELTGGDIKEQTYKDGAVTIRRQTMATESGEIWQTWRDGWHDQYLLKTAADYRTMTEIVRNTTLQSDCEGFQVKSEELGSIGVPLIAIGRTPLQTILVDFAGIENFAYHLVDFEEEVRTLYSALFDQFRKRVEIASKVPGRFVSNLENFTAESLGPVRYEEFLLPVYEECFPILHDAGKIVGSHYDGHTASCKEVIARAPIDLIESLTEPSEGDQPISQARAVWPDKLFWCNIRVGDYGLPPKQLRDKVLALVEEGAVDGRQLAFEVSEQYPDNWRDSIPVVLKALEETSV